MRNPLFSFALLIALSASWLAPPQTRAEPVAVTAAAGVVTVGVVTVDGEVSKPLRLDADALATFPRITVEAKDHGTPARWEGVRLIDLLREAGLPTGEAMRGKSMSLYVRLTGADGYRAVYALAELDQSFHDGEVLLVDRRDGKPLEARHGPYRVVSTSDKRAGRWVRQVVAIDVLRAP